MAAVSREIGRLSHWRIKKINSYLIEQVKRKFPNHAVDGEEEQFGEGKYVWVCDPVDGTAMYARHIPVAVFSLALVVDGEPMLGVIFDPFANELYSAIKGQGAFKNDKKIMVNDYELDDIRTLCQCDLLSKKKYDVYEIYKNIHNATNICDIGSTARAGCCVATGDFSLAIMAGVGHKNCDIAAVKIIVEEAGGKVTNLFGDEQRYDGDVEGAVISNGKIHNDIVKMIKKYLIVK